MVSHQWTRRLLGKRYQKNREQAFFRFGGNRPQSILTGGVFTRDNLGQTRVLRYQGLQNCRGTSLLQHNGSTYAGTISGILFHLITEKAGLFQMLVLPTGAEIIWLQKIISSLNRWIGRLAIWLYAKQQ